MAIEIIHLWQFLLEEFIGSHPGTEGYGAAEDWNTNAWEKSTQSLGLPGFSDGLANKTFLIIRQFFNSSSIDLHFSLDGVNWVNDQLG